MAVVSVPKALRDKLTEAGAEALISLLDKMEENGRRAVLEVSEGRFERRLVEVKTELKSEIVGVDADLRAEIAGVKADLRAEIAQTKAEIIKWMFIFWVGQIGATAGILFAFHRL